MLHTATAPRRTDQRGFALSELLLVVVFATGLLLVAYVAARGISDSTADSDCQTQLRTLKLAVEEFHAQSGSYPNGIRMLELAKLVDAEDVELWEVSFAPGDTAPTYRALSSRCDGVEA